MDKQKGGNMAILEPFSIRYLVISGKYRGMIGVIRELENADNESIGVIFPDQDGNEIITMKKRDLSQIETPGWPDCIDESYGFKEYLKEHKGDGSCMLRASSFAQPRALKTGDVLATGEIVLSYPRRGYNSSTLIRLNRTGWVEMASRLPVAFSNNKNFKLPGDLARNDKLATNCLVVKESTFSEINWVNIFLDRKEDRCIKTPSCVPLAMA